jgi:hypothetical protein
MQHTNVGCLAGFVWSQVTLELSMSMRIRADIQNLHTYMYSYTASTPNKKDLC